MTDDQFARLQNVLVAQTAVMHGILVALRALSKDDSGAAVDWDATLNLLTQAGTVGPRKPEQQAKKGK